MQHYETRAQREGKYAHGGPFEVSSVEAAQIEPRHQRTQIPPAGPHANTAGGPSLSRLAPNQAKNSGPWGSAFDWCVLDSHHTTQATPKHGEFRGILPWHWTLGGSETQPGHCGERAVCGHVAEHGLGQNSPECCFLCTGICPVIDRGTLVLTYASQSLELQIRCDHTRWQLA